MSGVVLLPRRAALADTPPGPPKTVPEIKREGRA